MYSSVSIFLNKYLHFLISEKFSGEDPYIFSSDPAFRKKRILTRPSLDKNFRKISAKKFVLFGYALKKLYFDF